MTSLFDLLFESTNLKMIYANVGKNCKCHHQSISFFKETHFINFQDQSLWPEKLRTRLRAIVINRFENVISQSSPQSCSCWIKTLKEGGLKGYFISTFTGFFKKCISFFRILEIVIFTFLQSLLQGCFCCSFWK